MNALSIRTLLESLAANRSVRNAAGEIRDIESLLCEETLHALQQICPGPYAFLLFDHRIDCGVTDYVRSGTLAADSGRLLVLFPSDTRAFGLRSIASIVPRTLVDVYEDNCLMRATLLRLFPAEAGVVLPGILFFAQFVRLADAVFIPLAGLDMQDVATRLRGAFAVVNRIQASTKSQEAITIDISYGLEKARIPHRAISGPPLKEYLLRFWRYAKEKPFDILSVLK